MYDCSLRDEFKTDGSESRPSEYQTANGTRIKQMSFYNNYLMTLMSCGALSLWRLMRKNTKLIFVASVNVGCRPICMKIMGPLAQVMPIPIQMAIDNVKEERSSAHDVDGNLLVPLVDVHEGKKSHQKKKQRNGDSEHSENDYAEKTSASKKGKRSKKGTRYEDDFDFKI